VNERAVIETARAYGAYEGRITLGVGHGETLVRYAREAVARGRALPTAKAILEAAGESEQSNEVLRERVRHLEKRVEVLETELAWVGRSLSSVR
jgi:hypothetical protein